ncbi:RagB/SusD family nutrient uptake outer membrane protein [Aquimarina gracilis]|uniref:RagB/SusD family nutrient uptake outer membrane protein n=1 Tax=Aquimarina gracilis TaxID=874422 RepID=A0ABU5ZRQ0_9FLAO|nr:RagB/SusD family nutrient uptake outer membrane protein [Aquimarina gracilis]MEB3344730.1 RagB/SusD family nutrient uptake outer membrane protein [Aquimarina gracilis]
MKNLKILIGILFMFSLIGCEDFLEEDPVAFRAPTTFYSKPSEIDQAIAAVYRINRNLHNQLQQRFGESRSDNTNIEITGDGGGFGDDQLNEFTMDAANGRISDYWNTNYSGISRANFLLASIDGVDYQENVITKDARKGEAVFLRALFYFNLVRIYGDVPYVIEPGLTPDQILSEEFIERDPAAEIYVDILNEAQTAIDLLPVTTDDPGRATRGAALMLKAKIHMAQEQYAEARPLLQEITTLGYSLLPNYSDVFFTRNHDEGIFEIQYSPGLDQGADFFRNYVPFVSGQDILGDATTPNSRGNQFQPTQNLIDLYNTQDERFQHNISVYNDTIRDTDGNIINIDDYYWASKFAFPFDENQPNQQNINWQMYRYADALLMLAECYEKVGGGDPIAIIEQIRTRAGLADPTLSASELGDLEQTIADERRRELAFEAHRYFDLLRTGKLEEVMRAHGVDQIANGLTVTPDAYQNIRTVIGIPFNQVLAFGFEQTPGWE